METYSQHDPRGETRRRVPSSLRLAWLLGAAALIAAAAAPPARAQQPEVPPGPDAGAAASPPSQVEELKREIDQLRRDYDARLAALEKKLADLVAAPAAAPPQEAAPSAPPVEAQAPSMPPPSDQAAPPGVTPPPPSSGKVFNPDIAVIGNFLGAAGRNRIEPSDALSLQEAEASFQAVVDPYARADFFFSFSPEGVDVEEGFITFTSLPSGLLLKAGKMRGQFGKVNTLHTHTMPWVDRPLVTRNLVGGDEGISQPGLSLSKLFPNPALFLEAIGEVYGGDSDVFHAESRSDLTYVGRLHGYRDLTEGTNLDLGTSVAYGQTDLDPDATRRLIGVDATFRWRPLRRAIYKRFLGRTELVWSHDDLAETSPTSFGAYVSGEYQFARRWFAGGRYDFSERAADPASNDRGVAALLTYWPSEFSQIRGEYRRTRYAEGTTANELLFQFLFSIGAHGAHVF